MSRYHSYLNSAKEILSVYKGDEPFASFLKKYFSQYKKYGSKDRKQIAHLCYCYFRLGKSLDNFSIEEKMMAGLFLCSKEMNKILEEYRSGMNESIHLPLKKKFSILNDQFSLLTVFPWKEELSIEIDHEEFGKSFFQQPDLFIRLRPGKEKIVKEKLKNAKIDFKVTSDSCLALNNSAKIDSIIELDEEAVVQDYNSQQIRNFIPVRLGESDQIWDCCAGSGGKSIMAYDLDPNVQLTISDVRESILINLKNRFKSAGIKNYKSLIADLTSNQQPVTENFDLIIADVPCTGSGTWSRTPEQLFYFTPEKINDYSSLQRRIISNVIPHLKDSGYLLYITCSVFKKENEEVVECIQKEFHLELIKMEVLKGYEKKADTMFAALLKKSL